MKVAAETTSGCRRLLTQLGCSRREGAICQTLGRGCGLESRTRGNLRLKRANRGHQSNQPQSHRGNCQPEPEATRESKRDSPYFIRTLLPGRCAAGQKATSHHYGCLGTVQGLTTPGRQTRGGQETGSADGLLNPAGLNPRCG